MIATPLNFRGVVAHSGKPAPRQFRFSLRTLFVAMIFAGGVLFLVRPVAQMYEYVGRQRAGSQLIASLENRRPSTTSAAEWEHANSWMGIAFANVCYSPEHVSFAELQQFNVDLSCKLEGDVDLETVNWIWRRLAATGPHGARYVAKFEPRYSDELAEIQRLCLP